MKLLTKILATCLLGALLATGGAGAPPQFDSARLAHSTSWVGNTYPGAKKWVQQDIRALCVLADGTLFSNVEWDEAGGNVGEYRDGELIRYAMHTHGWGANGGLGIAANSQYVFIGMVMGNEGGGLKDPDTWPPKGSRWFGVSRRLRSDITKAAPFVGGKGGKGDTLKQCFRVVAETPDKGGAPLAGLVATEKELFVSEPNAGEIQVFDTQTMALLHRWKIERAGPLAMDRAGTIAMLQSPQTDAPARVLLLDRDGQSRIAATPPPDSVPAAICFSHDRLLIADRGPSQQILVYAPASGAQPMQLERHIGVAGGLLAPPTGKFGDLRFHDVTAIGCDDKGNLYVAHDGQTGGGGTVLESYALATGTLNWRLCGLTFVDLADVDPAGDADIFTKEEHFAFDYAKAAGREASYIGYTVNRFKYPQDPRLHIWSAGAWVRRIEGQRVLFVNDMNGEALQVYRFTPQTDGETAIPSGLFAKRRLVDKKNPDWPPHQPAKGQWIWRDASGNGAFEPGEFDAQSEDAPASQGWWVDAGGNVWLATETRGIRFFPVGGLDGRGNPLWSYDTMQTFPAPAEFKTIKRLRYLPDSDTMYLAGTTEEHKNQHWKPSGPVLARYDGWCKGARTLRWKIVAPYAVGAAGHASCEPMGFDVAGNFVFVPYTGASKPSGVKYGRVEIFRAADGQSVGHLEPDAAVDEIGLQDIRECLIAHRRAEGEFIIFIEDDYKAKVVVYRIPKIE